MFLLGVFDRGVFASGVDKEMWFRFLGYMYNLWVAERQRWTAEAVLTEERDALIKVVDAHARGMEVETMFQSMAEVTYQQGREKGKEEGREQGETRAKQTALLKLLHHQFQSVPETVTTRIHSLRDPAHLDTLFEKALNAEHLQDIDWDTENA